MSNNVVNYQMKIKRLVVIALFAALAYVSTLVIHIPVPPFLTLDFKDAVITLAAMSLGPVAGIVVSAVAAFLEFITISGTGVHGLIMNFLGSAVFSVVAASIYKYKKTLFGGVIGLVAAVFAMTATMILANILITPHFMTNPNQTVTVGDVVKMIPKIFFPFNLLKAITNAALVIGFYKPVSNGLKAIGAVNRKNDEKIKFDKITVLLLFCAAVVATISITVMFYVMG